MYPEVEVIAPSVATTVYLDDNVSVTLGELSALISCGCLPPCEVMHYFGPLLLVATASRVVGEGILMARCNQRNR